LSQIDEDEDQKEFHELSVDALQLDDVEEDNFSDRSAQDEPLDLRVIRLRAIVLL